MILSRCDWSLLGLQVIEYLPDPDKVYPRVELQDITLQQSGPFGILFSWAFYALTLIYYCLSVKVWKVLL